MEKLKRSILTTNLLLTGVFLFCVLFVSAHTSTWWYIVPFVISFIVSSYLALRAYLTFFRD
jgi:hypothetical protein